jgi:hypothetical protein
MKTLSKVIVTAVIVSLCVLGWFFIGHRQPSSLSTQNRQTDSKATSLITTTAIDSKETKEDSVNKSGTYSLDEEFRRTIEQEVISASSEATEQFLKERNPKEFVKLKWKNEAPYALTKRLLTPDSLPILYTLLDDIKYAEYWPRIVEVISYLSEDQKSLSVILNYITRADDWTSLEAYDLSTRCRGKINSLKWIGLIGGGEADKILRQALTSDGARKLIKDWINGPLPKWASVYWENDPAGQLIQVIQGYAAIGIVLSQNQQSIQLVEELYETIRIQHIGDGNRSPELMSKLREAKAIIKAIKELGFEEYRNQLGTTELGVMSSQYKDQLSSNVDNK